MVHEDPSLLEPGRADRDILMPFYARAAAVIRRSDPDAIIFFQPATFPVPCMRAYHNIKSSL